MAYTKRFIFSVGGSLIIPASGVDVSFIKNFITLVRSHVIDHPDHQIFIVTGGGKTCRDYQDAARKVNPDITKDNVDWVGTYTTQFNAHFIRILLGDIVHPETIVDYSSIMEVEKPIAVGAGWLPGHSTDVDAVLIAEQYHVDTVINLSNIDYVFDKDPRQFSDAKPYVHLTWSDMQSIVGEEWTPGKHTPFDPIASKKATELGLTVIVANGNNFENLQHILRGENYIGTTITR